MYENNLNVVPRRVEIVEERYADCPHCTGFLDHVATEEFDCKRLLCQQCPEDLVSDGEGDHFRSLEGPMLECAVCLGEVHDYRYVERDGSILNRPCEEFEAVERMQCTECQDDQTSSEPTFVDTTETCQECGDELNWCVDCGNPLIPDYDFSDADLPVCEDAVCTSCQ